MDCTLVQCMCRRIATLWKRLHFAFQTCAVPQNSAVCPHFILKRPSICKFTLVIHLAPNVAFHCIQSLTRKLFRSQQSFPPHLHYVPTFCLGSTSSHNHELTLHNGLRVSNPTSETDRRRRRKSGRPTIRPDLPPTDKFLPPDPPHRSD